MGSSGTVYFTINQTKTFHIILDSIDYVVTVRSNFTVSDLLFNQTLKQISFNINGIFDADAFCKVTIPSELLDGPFSIKAKRHKSTSYGARSSPLRDASYLEKFAVEYEVNDVKGRQILRRCQSCFEKMHACDLHPT